MDSDDDDSFHSASDGEREEEKEQQETKKKPKNVKTKAESPAPAKALLAHDSDPKNSPQQQQLTDPPISSADSTKLAVVDSGKKKKSSELAKASTIDEEEKTSSLKAGKSSAPKSASGSRLEAAEEKPADVSAEEESAVTSEDFSSSTTGEKTRTENAADDERHSSAPEEEEEDKDDEEEKGESGGDQDGWDVDDWQVDEEELKTPAEEPLPPLPMRSKTSGRHHQHQHGHSHHKGALHSSKDGDENAGFTTDDHRQASAAAAAETTKHEQNRPNSLWEWGGSLKGIVSAVGEGFSTVLESVETGLGAPTPEALARLTLSERAELEKKVEQVKEPWPATDHDDCDSATDEALSDVGSETSGLPPYNEGDQCSSGYQSDGARSRELDPSLALSALTGGSGIGTTTGGITGLFSGMGKSLVSGSLDVLESLGKKTFETLTVAEQGAKGQPAKRRLIFQRERPNLSKVIRELQQSHSGTEMRSQQEDEEARLSNFAFLFEKNEGMVHLEGLEMLSDNCARQVETALVAGIDQETLDQLDGVRDLYDGLTDDESISDEADVSFEADVDALLKKIGLAFNPSKLIQTNKRLLDWLDNCRTEQDLGDRKAPKEVHQRAIQALSEFTARCVETLHKLGQLVLVAGAAPEPKPFFDIVQVFCAEISVLTAKFSNCLNTAADDSEDPDAASPLLTNIFLEANNSTNYLREALRLIRPVLERAIILERNTSVA